MTAREKGLQGLQTKITPQASALGAKPLENFIPSLAKHRQVDITLSASEKALIQGLWTMIAPQASTLGAEALERLFLSFPQTKNYFSHFDLSHGSADLFTIGSRIFNALGEVATHLDDLDSNLSLLSDLNDFRLNPKNFVLLSHTIQIVLASHFPQDFTAEAQAAWEKFMSVVSTILTSKYR